LPAGDTPAKPGLIQRRALAIASILHAQGIKVVARPGVGSAIVPVAASEVPVQ
jgi:hypothetical protein